MMSHSLYVKANGEMPCWDDIGEALTLRTLDEGALQDNRELPIFHGAELQQIRQSFISGHDPHPELCRLCAVRGHTGIETTLHPSTMEVLHLEASYLCHLSCDQCIPAEDRRALKGPPYNMTTGLLDGLLRQLRREGVEHIRFIHFEGRGDPLVNPRLPHLIESSRRHFPRSLIGVTTHCSYPYMPWVARSELDVLRASIDGATPESYLKYRVGGSFERTIEFLRKLRDDRIRARSALRVEWKFILFEWNDSDSEMQRAVELAKELQVHLTFMRTHTPGRSLRFSSDAELHQWVRRFAPGSAVEQTFQLRSASEVSTSAVIADHVAALMSLAIERIRAGDHSDALGRLAEALKHDPGISVSQGGGIGEMICEALPPTLASAQFPSTLTWLAAVSREIGDSASCSALLSRYLEMAPEAPDRGTVEKVIKAIIADQTSALLALAIDRIRAGDQRGAVRCLVEALRNDPGISVSQTVEISEVFREWLPRILADTQFPSTLSGLAAVSREIGDNTTSNTLLSTYLEVAPEAPDRNHILSDHLVHAAVQLAVAKQFDLAHAALGQAFHLQFGVSPDFVGTSNPFLFHLDQILPDDCSPSIIVGFACVALAQNYFPAARALFRKYVEIAPEAGDRQRVDKIIADIDDRLRRDILPNTFSRRVMNLLRRVFTCR
ncbi:MAG TPA: radical SAM protein [Terriglobia bacterium]|nr:radical SAM protein [Terriglobia bacterium]